MKKTFGHATSRLQKLLHKPRKPAVEKLESRHLMATLFSENFDPINASNFSSRLGSVVTGTSLPGDYHVLDTLYFNGGLPRSVTTKPIDVDSGILSFRMRLGNRPSGPFEDIDAGEEVVLEASTNLGATWSLITEFSANGSTFSSAGTWDLFSTVIPESVTSSQTLFRWRQKLHSGNCCDHWGLDEILITGQANPFDFEPLTPFLRTPVERTVVVFSIPIDAATLTVQDLSLKRSNVDVPLDASVRILPLGNDRYEILGLTPFTQTPGSYELKLSGLAIENATGQPLLGEEYLRWVMETTKPVLVDVLDVTPDPRSGAGKAVSSVDVVFSEPIDLTTFDYQDLTLKRDNGPDLIDSSVVILPTGLPNQLRISNLQNLTAPGGKYQLLVDGDFADFAGNIGANLRSDTWLANDAPVVAVGGTLVFPEDSRPLAIAGGGLIFDLDSPDFRNGSLTVTNTNAKPEDQLSIFHRPASITRIGIRGSEVLYESRVIGTFTGGVGLAPLVISLNSRATVEAVQALLRNIAFQYVGDVPVQESRILQVVAEDGEGGRSNVSTMKVLLAPVNDAPLLALNTAGPLAYAANSLPLAFAPLATISDVDNPTFYNGTLVVQVTQGRDSSEQLGVSGAFSIVNRSLLHQGVAIGVLNADGLLGRTLTIRFNELVTQAIAQDLVRSLTFSTAQNRVLGRRALDVLLRDGRGGVSSTETAFIDVA